MKNIRYVPRFILTYIGKKDVKQNLVENDNGYIKSEFIDRKTKELDLVLNSNLTKYQKKSNKLVKLVHDLEEQKEATDQEYNNFVIPSANTSIEEVMLQNLAIENKKELKIKSIQFQKQINNTQYQIDQIYLKLKLRVERNVQRANRQFIIYGKFPVANQVGQVKLVNSADYFQNELIKEIFNQ